MKPYHKLIYNLMYFGGYAAFLVAAVLLMNVEMNDFLEVAIIILVGIHVQDFCEGAFGKCQTYRARKELEFIEEQNKPRIEPYF